MKSICNHEGFPGGTAGKDSVCYVGDLGSVPGLERSPGNENGYPFQYSGLENSMDCIVHGVTKSQTWLCDFHFHTIMRGKYYFLCFIDEGKWGSMSLHAFTKEHPPVSSRVGFSLFWYLSHSTFSVMGREIWLGLIMVWNSKVSVWNARYFMILVILVLYEPELIFQALWGRFLV